jgi:hypothetical protein
MLREAVRCGKSRARCASGLIRLPCRSRSNTAKPCSSRAGARQTSLSMAPTEIEASKIDQEALSFLGNPSLRVADP